MDATRLCVPSKQGVNQETKKDMQKTPQNPKQESNIGEI